MSLKASRCVVVEVPSEDDPTETVGLPQDLLPWADPYIARLLCKHRLQAALEDSVRYVKSVAAERANRPHSRLEPAAPTVPAALGPQSLYGWSD